MCTRITLLTLASLAVPVSADAQMTDRPDWAEAGVPDSVWMLVESSAAEGDDDARKALLKQAEEHARASLVGHEEDVGRRLGLAVVLGARANTEGGKTKVRAASGLHSELEAILALDPDHTRAHHLLGRLHAGVRRMNRVTRWLATNLLGGGPLKKATWEEAERHLRFAEEHSPEVADHHLQLANLLKDRGRKEEALHEVLHVLELPAGTAMEMAVLEEANEMYSKLVDQN